MDSQGCFPLGLRGWLPCWPKDSQQFSSAPQFESNHYLVLSLLYGSALASVHDYWKNHSFDYMDLCQQNNVSAFNVLSRFVITFLLRSKHVLISWLQSPSTVILEPKEIKSLTAPTFSPSVHPYHSILFSIEKWAIKSRKNIDTPKCIFQSLKGCQKSLYTKRFQLCDIMGKA